MEKNKGVYTFYENTLSRDTFVGGGWWKEPWFSLTIGGDYQREGGFLFAEADDYGYREYGEVIAYGWGFFLSGSVRWKDFQFGGSWRFHKESIGAYTLDQHEENIFVKYTSSSWGFRASSDGIRTTLEGKGSWWFFWMPVSIGTILQWDEGLIWNGSIGIANTRKTLALEWQFPLYRERAYRELMTISWLKRWNRFFVGGSLGLSEWDAGRIQIGVGMIW